MPRAGRPKSRPSEPFHTHFVRLRPSTLQKLTEAANEEDGPAMLRWNAPDSGYISDFQMPRHRHNEDEDNIGAMGDAPPSPTGT